MNIAFKNHKDQVDKAGTPYIFHPMYVAMQMTTEETVCVALLHDVIEDSNMTISDLRNLNFPEPILEALSLMTHDKSVPYFDYIEKIKGNPIARQVKIADLKHNSDLSRLVGEPSAKDLERVKKYAKALSLLDAPA